MKRTPMPRTSSLRKPDGSARLNVKLTKCKACRAPFVKTRMEHKFCGAEACAVAAAEEATAKRAKTAKKAAALDRKETREKLVKLKKRADWLKEAKQAIQKARRLEELAKGSGCMSCGRSQEEVEGADGWKPGGAWDGGHFLGKGARPELALEPLNIWLQCKSCNAGSGKYARKGYTVNQNFRANLIAAEGLALVEWLEGPHEPKHYTVDDLIAIKATYSAKARALKKAAE